MKQHLIDQGVDAVRSDVIGLGGGSCRGLLARRKLMKGVRRGSRRGVRGCGSRRREWQSGSTSRCDF